MSSSRADSFEDFESFVNTVPAPEPMTLEQLQTLVLKLDQNFRILSRAVHKMQEQLDEIGPVLQALKTWLQVGGLIANKKGP